MTTTYAGPAALSVRAWSPEWRTIAVGLAAVVVALLFRLALPAGAQVNESADYTTFYEPVARNLLAGAGLTFRDGQPATAYPPGHPIVLAGTFWIANLLGVSETSMLALAAALVMGIGSMLLYGLARRVWSPRAALVAPLLWMTYPFALWLTKQPNSELPFIVALFAAWYVLWRALLEGRARWQPFFVCGLIAGVAMLIRPIGIGLGLVFCVILWLMRRELPRTRRAQLVGWLLLGNLIAVLPWEVWLYNHTGNVVLLSTNGPASIQDGLTFALPNPQRAPIPVPANVTAVMSDVQAHAGRLTSVGAIAALMLAELRTRPVAVGELLALKAARSWYGTDSGRQEKPILLLQTLYLLMFGAAIYRMVKTRRSGEHRERIAMLFGVLGVVLYFWGMTVMALSILRYMIPAIGLLFLLTPALLPPWGDRMGDRITAVT